MDWSFGRDFDFHIVPNDQELSDDFVSPECLIQQSVIKESPYKYHVGGESVYGLNTWDKLPLVDCDDMKIKAHVEKTGLLGDQLNGLGSMNRIGDIFLSSQLDKDPYHMKNSYQPMNTYSASEVPFNNHLTNMNMESHRIPAKHSSMGNLNYLDKACQTSVWANLAHTPPHVMMSDSGQRKCSWKTEAPELMVMMPDELNTSQKEFEYMDTEISLEAMVLEDLELVIGQMTPKMRICFRDALYRLSKHLRQQNLQSCQQSEELTMDVPCSSSVHHVTSRSRGMKPMELETNAVDRTVVNLMFNKPNCNQLDPSSITSVNLSKEAVSSSHESYNYSLDQQSTVSYYPSILSYI